MTGAEVLEALREHGVDFVGELVPFDRIRIEQALDAKLGEESESDADAAKEATADKAKEIGLCLKRRFKTWITDQLAEHPVACLDEKLNDNFDDLVDDVLDEEGVL